MKNRLLILGILAILISGGLLGSRAWGVFKLNQFSNLVQKISHRRAPADSKTKVSTAASDKIKLIKDVGEAYLDHFGLTADDFQLLQDAKFEVIEGNFDICASEEDVSYFLDQSLAHSLKVVMPAGSGEAEWGYACDQDSYPLEQKPVWDKRAVTAWIEQWKDHPAVYAWDTSNEAGSVFPNPVPENMLSTDQLKTAYRDVKAADGSHPVIIRQNGWFYYDFEDNFFREGNPFTVQAADIVMINAYSNVLEYFPDFVSTVTNRSVQALQNLDPRVKVIVALGVWEEKPIWVKPTADKLNNDLEQLQRRDDLFGVAYFKYGAKESEWYLPDSSKGAPELWSIIAASGL